MITEHLRDITDINLDLLPSVIKIQFEKIRFLFNTKPLGIHYSKSFFSNVYADTPLVLSIKELDKRTKFNMNIKDAIDSYDDGYDDGTCTTYIFEGRTKEEEQIFEVFQGIYNKLPSIQHSYILQFKKNIPHYNEIGFLHYQFEKYGRETAKFITNWTIILNNANLFEDIFKKYYATETVHSNSPIIPETTQQTENNKTEDKYKTQNLFKVGLLFATGEMNKYFTVTSLGDTAMNDGYSAPSIAKELGNEAYNKWILATIKNYTTDNPNGNKNIFNSRDMMTKIITHCTDNKLPIEPYFLSRLPIEKI